MARSVVAIDAIHSAPNAAFLWRFSITELGDGSVTVRELNLVYVFARLIRAISNRYIRINVPVNAG